MPLFESRVPADPLVLFQRWFREAKRKGAPQPDAIALATADARGTPSARMVLFKGLDGDRSCCTPTTAAARAATLRPTAGPVSYTHLTLPTICSV